MPFLFILYIIIHMKVIINENNILWEIAIPKYIVYYYYYYYFYSYHESGFLSHIYIKVNRLFTPVKKFKCKRGLFKQLEITRSKLSKETQEEAVKQVQSQQYRHQSDILDIALLPSPSSLYLIHTRCSLHISI